MVMCCNVFTGENVHAGVEKSGSIVQGKCQRGKRPTGMSNCGSERRMSVDLLCRSVAYPARKIPLHYVTIHIKKKNQRYKSESSALDEIQNERSRCVAAVTDCSKRQDRKRQTQTSEISTCLLDDAGIACSCIKLHCCTFTTTLLTFTNQSINQSLDQLSQG